MKALLQRIIAWALRRRIVRALLLYTEHRGAQLADSITYRALFSVFAAVLLGFSVAALWFGGNPDAMRALSDALDTVIPGISKVIDPTQIDAPTGFTLVGVASLIGLVGAAIGAIGSLRSALHLLSDQIADPTFFLWVVLRNLLVAVCFGGLLGVAAAASFFGFIGDRAGVSWLGLAAGGWLGAVVARVGGGIIVFLIDTVAVAVAFRLLAGIRPPARALWIGSAIGGLGLIVLQALSGLFVRGATSNPLLASFAAMIALLLWFNLSAQVVLIASSYIITAAAESGDVDRELPTTFAQRRLQRAEDRLRSADAEWVAAHDAEQQEREGAEQHEGEG